MTVEKYNENFGVIYNEILGYANRLVSRNKRCYCGSSAVSYIYLEILRRGTIESLEGVEDLKRYAMAFLKNSISLHKSRLNSVEQISECDSVELIKQSLEEEEREGVVDKFLDLFHKKIEYDEHVVRSVVVDVFKRNGLKEQVLILEKYLEGVDTVRGLQDVTGISKSAIQRHLVEINKQLNRWRDSLTKKA